MGQTIICEYLAAWESTGTQPDPTKFGFDGLYSMLEECQDTMLKLGTAANDGKRRIAELEAELAYLRYFHRKADFGPAHTDVVMAMQAAYPDTVPDTWLYE